MNDERRPLSPKHRRRLEVLEEIIAMRISRVALHSANGRSLGGAAVRFAREATALKWALDKLGLVFVDVPEAPASAERLEETRQEIERTTCARRIICRSCRRSSNCALEPGHAGYCDPLAPVATVHCTEVPR